MGKRQLAAYTPEHINRSTYHNVRTTSHRCFGTGILLCNVRYCNARNRLQLNQIRSSAFSKIEFYCNSHRTQFTIASEVAMFIWFHFIGELYEYEIQFA